MTFRALFMISEESSGCIPKGLPTPSARTYTVDFNIVTGREKVNKHSSGKISSN